MANFSVQISKVTTNGPYAYVVFKNNVGEKAVNNIATISAALDGVKTDIAGLLLGEVVDRVGMSVQSK